MGLWQLDGRPVDRAELARMTEALAHRGPDGSGVWLEESVGLGHRMLWTTPESLHEKLPAVGTGGRLVITADARIDNREELARQLALRLTPELGDSALILAAYEQWGERCPEKLVGDFAFAIWDRQARTLFAARDRIGIKPVYYHYREGQVFAFASEIAPLFQATGLEKQPEQDAIREILATFATAHGRTLFKGVQRLPPASTLMLRGGNLGVRRYWEPSAGQGRRKPDLAGHTEEFRHLFSEAVRAQTRSAYPIGCLLGGGLDAASVLCVAARLVPDTARLSSYSMVFDRLPCDEREFIEPTVRQAGVESVFTIADAAPVEGWEGLRACHESLPDWPVQGLPKQSLWPLLEAAKARGVRVMLTGIGGDEVTQGSPYYLADLLTSGYWLTLAQELKRYRFSPHVLWFWMLEAILPEWACTLGRRFKDRVRGPSDASFFFGGKEQAAWMEGQQLPRKGFPSASAWHEASAVVNPGIGLAFEGSWEVLGQRSGLEFRHPFYDARLVEFLLSVPSEEKRRQGTTKYLLREAMKNVLPEDLRRRKGKAEFSPMIAPRLDSMTFDPGSLALTRSGVLPASRVVDVVARRAAQPTPLSALVLWQLAVLETWYRLHFKPN